MGVPAIVFATLVDVCQIDSFRLPSMVMVAVVFKAFTVGVWAFADKKIICSRASNNDNRMVSFGLGIGKLINKI